MLLASAERLGLRRASNGNDGDRKQRALERARHLASEMSMHYAQFTVTSCEWLGVPPMVEVTTTALMTLIIWSCAGVSVTV